MQSNISTNNVTSSPDSYVLSPYFSSITIFGDSQSDYGNILRQTNGSYGQFTDRKTWCQYMSSTLHLPINSFAHGGATSKDLLGKCGKNDEIETTDLPKQVDNALANKKKINKGDIAVVSIGGNDFWFCRGQSEMQLKPKDSYLYDVIGRPEATAERVLNQVSRLRDKGYTTVTATLPPYEIAPAFSHNTTLQTVVRNWVNTYNNELQSGVASQQVGYLLDFHKITRENLVLWNQTLNIVEPFADNKNRGPEQFLFYDALHFTHHWHSKIGTQAAACLAQQLNISNVQNATLTYN
jgi:phospholipase/lecithinase/hemolysin